MEISTQPSRIDCIKIRDTFVSGWMWLIDVFGFPRQYARQRSMTCSGQLAKTEQLANRESLCRIYGVLFLRSKVLICALVQMSHLIELTERNRKVDRIQPNETFNQFLSNLKRRQVGSDGSHMDHHGHLESKRPAHPDSQRPKQRSQPFLSDERHDDASMTEQDTRIPTNR